MEHHGPETVQPLAKLPQALAHKNNWPFQRRTRGLPGSSDILGYSK